MQTNVGGLQLPAEALLGLDYLIGVYARAAAAHVPLVVELPLLVAVALRRPSTLTHFGYDHCLLNRAVRQATAISHTLLATT